MSKCICIDVSDQTVQSLKVGQTVRAVVVGTVKSLEGSEQPDSGEMMPQIGGAMANYVMPARVEIETTSVSVVGADPQMEQLMSSEEGD